MTSLLLAWMKISSKRDLLYFYGSKFFPFRTDSEKGGKHETGRVDSLKMTESAPPYFQNEISVVGCIVVLRPR